MPQNVVISQNARRALQIIDELQALYSGVVNDPEDRRATSDLVQDLRDAIESVQNVLSRLTEATESTVRDELSAEREAKSSAQEQRFANGPSCD